MADQNGLQLLPETRKRINVRIPGENKVIYIGVAILVSAAALVIGLNFYSSSLKAEIVQINFDIVTLDQQRDQKAEQNILTLSKQLALMSNLLDNHNIWSNALDKIGKMVAGQIQFESFSGGSLDGKIDFRALAANYTTIAKQIASFNSDNLITNIGLSNVTRLTNGRLEFNMHQEFDNN